MNDWRVEARDKRARSWEMVTNGDERFLVQKPDVAALVEYLNALERENAALRDLHELYREERDHLHVDALKEENDYLRGRAEAAESRAKAAEEERDELRAVLEALMREYATEEKEHGFPFNIALRDAHREASQALAEPEVKP